MVWLIRWRDIREYISISASPGKVVPNNKRDWLQGMCIPSKKNPYQIQQKIKSFKKEFSKLSNLIFLRFSSPFELVTYHNGVAKASVDPLKNTSNIF